MKIVTTGSRTWTDESKIKKVLQDWDRKYGSELTVVVGYDPIKKTPSGVDRMVYKWCKHLCIRIITEPADWKNGRIVRVGNRNVNLAGFDRNELMLDKHSPDKLVAFRSDGKSNGTDHCIKEARRRNIEVEVHREKGNRTTTH